MNANVEEAERWWMKVGECRNRGFGMLRTKEPKSVEYECRAGVAKIY
jgi:hypothetical protein